MASTPAGLAAIPWRIPRLNDPLLGAIQWRPLRCTARIRSFALEASRVNERCGRSSSTRTRTSRARIHPFNLCIAESAPVLAPSAASTQRGQHSSPSALEPGVTDPARVARDGAISLLR
jgi:hypothetical protein